MIPIRVGFTRGGTSCNKAMRTAGRAPQAVACLTHGVKLGQTRNINTRTHLLMPSSGQLPFLGCSSSSPADTLAPTVRLHGLADNIVSFELEIGITASLPTSSPPSRLHPQSPCRSACWNVTRRRIPSFLRPDSLRAAVRSWSPWYVPCWCSPSGRRAVYAYPSSCNHSTTKKVPLSFHFETHSFRHSPLACCRAQSTS